MAKAKIWARLIYKGVKTIDDVPAKMKDSVRKAYKELFGVEAQSAWPTIE